MDKNIILISTQNDIFRKNSQVSFKNRLFKHDYLDPETSYCIAPKLISIDLQFVNPACAEDPDYPALIACPVSRIAKIWKTLHGHERINIKRKFDIGNVEWNGDLGNPYWWTTWDENDENIVTVKKEMHIPLESFYTKHKYYFTPKKKYKVNDLFDEWYERESEYISLSTNPNQERLIKKDSDENMIFGHIGDIPDKTNEAMDIDNTINLVRGLRHIRNLHDNSNQDEEKEESNDETVLMFHENFVNSIKNKEFIKENTVNRSWVFDYGHFRIGKEKYYYYICVARRSGIKLNITNNGLDYQNPQILKIICKNINNIISNDSFSKMIGLLSIKPELVNGHLHHTFKEKEYYQLQHTANDVFHIELLDEKDQKIRIHEGLPTILDLRVKEIMNPDINVHIKSSDNHYFDNTPTNFKVHLVSSLNLNSDYRCALSSITYKNNFRHDAAFDFYFVCYQIGELEQIVESTKFDVGENCKNAEEILSKFEKTISNITINDANNSNLLTSYSFEGLMNFEFKVQVFLCFSYHLSRILGVMKNFTDEEEQNKIDEAEAGNYFSEGTIEHADHQTKIRNRRFVLDKINKTENPTDIIIKVGNDGYGGRFLSPRLPDKEYKIQQEFLFVNADFLQVSPVAHGSGRILKTISIPKNTTDEYVTMNFHNLDFHPLQYYNFQTLGFTLVSLTGAQLHVRDELEEENYNETHLSLVFKHFPP